MSSHLSVSKSRFYLAVLACLALAGCGGKSSGLAGTYQLEPEKPASEAERTKYSSQKITFEGDGRFLMNTGLLTKGSFTVQDKVVTLKIETVGENKLEDLRSSNQKSQPITLEIVEDGVLRPTYSIVTGQKLVFRKVK